MSGFSTTPAELLAASSSLKAARAALTAQLLSAAATVSARNLAAGADAYAETDTGAVPPGWV